MAGKRRILIAIVKYIEDKRNVRHDTEVMGVPVMLVVEDNIRYYSAFLPLIYTELITQSRGLISEGLNMAHKLVRMRARPKILLSTTYEDAVAKVLTYQDYLLGVVCDIEFPREGMLSPDSGFDLAHMVRSVVADAPIVLQSSRTQFMPRAQAEGLSFLRKRSPTLLLDLRRYLIEQFSFGDFVFRLPDRTEVARAKDLNALEDCCTKCRWKACCFIASGIIFRDGCGKNGICVGAEAAATEGVGFCRWRGLRRDIIDRLRSTGPSRARC